MALQRNALAQWSSRPEAARWSRQRGWPFVRISQKRTREEAARLYVIIDYLRSIWLMDGYVVVT